MELCFFFFYDFDTTSCLNEKPALPLIGRLQWEVRLEPWSAIAGNLHVYPGC